MYRTYITIGVALDVRGYIKVDDQIIGVYGCHPAPTKGSYMEINGEKRVVDEVKVDENWRWSAMFEEILSDETGFRGKDPKEMKRHYRRHAMKARERRAAPDPWATNYSIGRKAGADLVMGRFQELGGRAKHMAIGADGDMGDLLPYWVQTSLNEGGLKDQHVIKALSLLEDECNSHIENEEWYELPQITENGMRHEEELVYLNERAKKIKEEKALLRHGILIIMATNRWLALIYLLFFPFGV